MLSCEKVKLGPNIQSLVLLATVWTEPELSCDISDAMCLPFYYIGKQNICFIFGCLRRWRGFGVNMAVKKISSLFGPAYLGVLEHSFFFEFQI